MPLIAFAGALGGLAVVRWAYRTALRVNRELEEARLARAAEAARSNDIPTLRRDPITGAYRPGLVPAPTGPAEFRAPARSAGIASKSVAGIAFAGLGVGHDPGRDRRASLEAGSVRSNPFGGDG